MEINSIGKAATVAVLCENDQDEAEVVRSAAKHYRIYTGKVGSMLPNKVFAAVETAAKRHGLIDGRYRREHAVYHAALEAVQGVCRGQIALGEVLRTVGLRFAIAVGPRRVGDADTEWVAVALYGTIGAPVKGFEHETLGLGINHL